jgi:hypothetical protein
MSSMPCSRCGVAIESATAHLDDSGDPVCAACKDRADVDAGEQRAAGAIFSASAGAIGLGLIAVVWNPCLLMTILGVLTAGSTFTLIHRHPEYRRRMGWKAPAAMVIATIGMVLSVFAPIFSIVFRLGAR